MKLVFQNGIVGLALLSGVAHAQDDHDEITGGGAVTLLTKEILSTHQEHGNTIATLRVTARVDGVLQGTIESNETAKVHADGSIDVTARETFTGSVNGISGTLEFQEHSSIDSAGNTSGRFEVVNGSGGLAGARGRGTLQGTGDSNTYQIALRFH